MKTVPNIDLRVIKGNITHQQLADQMNVSLVTISRWFNNPSLGEVERRRIEIAIEKILKKSEENK